jgi:pSer/pThr/pTyr-binding forkhead associated (FHA) protein
MDVVIDDLYVSREHCVLELEDDGVRVDASKSVNRISVNGRPLEFALFSQAGTFTIGETAIHLRPASPSEDTTLVLSRSVPTLVFRRSTRELFAADGALIAQFSSHEGAALQAIVGAYPDAASTQQISSAVWGEPDYESYLIHRLMQRVRSRMGNFADLIENVRGAGYRLREPIDMR